MKKLELLLSASSKVYIPMTAILSILFSVCFGSCNALWGIPFPQGPGELEIQTFFRWQLLILPPFLTACEYLSCTKAMEVFIRIRVKNDRKLLRSQLTTCMLISFLWGTAVTAVGMITAPVEAGVWAFLITISGHMMWMSLYLTVYFLVGSESAALIAAVFSTASLYIVGELLNPRWKFLLTSWTMVSRSGIRGGRGIPVGLSLGGSVLVICFFMGIIYFINGKRRMKI